MAGIAKGRKLVAPRGRGTRPTSDRVREAVFSSLESLDAVNGARVLDLFAGSGAMGIEALSRGAREATFVDDAADAINSIRTNLSATGLSGATVVRYDAVGYLADGPEFDLAFVDPPYSFDDWNKVLETLRSGLLVLESGREVEVGEPWELLKVRRYGGTVVTIARRH